MIIYDNGEYTCVWRAESIKPLRRDYTWHPTPEAARLFAMIRGRPTIRTGHNDFNTAKSAGKNVTPAAFAKALRPGLNKVFGEIELSRDAQNQANEDSHSSKQRETFLKGQL